MVGQGKRGLCCKVLCLQTNGDDPMERTNFMMQQREGGTLRREVPGWVRAGSPQRISGRSWAGTLCLAADGDGGRGGAGGVHLMMKDEGRPSWCT